MDNVLHVMFVFYWYKLELFLIDIRYMQIVYMLVFFFIILEKNNCCVGYVPEMGGV